MSLRAWSLGVGLFALACLVYAPEVRNGFIWDDPEHVVHNPLLKTPDGLIDIWLSPRLLPQYYPVVHTTFWAEAQLWGTDRPVGYHVDNVLLHAAAAVLLWRVLLMLELPGAWLAAAVFAVHPVTVESVAWITERKNVLSLCFYLSAMIVYFRASPLAASQSKQKPSQSRKRRLLYFLSIGLFVLALLSKTVTCSLPAAILLLTFWKRGRLTKADIKPTLLLFVIGLALAAFTAHLETTHVGASGRDFAFTPVDRLLIAGRAVWFYLGKLVLPVDLIFMYPKWPMNGGTAYAYPAAAAAVLVALWLLRSRIGRGPVVTAMLFVGTLVPALGFFNVYPMRYSFVADHFQYLAMPAVIAAVVAVVHRKARGPVFAVVIVVLSVLTWRRQSAYRDANALWVDTIDRNPNCWMAHVNLALDFRQQGRFSEADDQSFDALRLEPNEPDTHYEVARVYQRLGRRDEAIGEYRNALSLFPAHPPILSSLARVLWDRNTAQDQADAFKLAAAAFKSDDTMADAADVLGQEKMVIGDYAGAIPFFEKAAGNKATQLPRTHVDLGTCLIKVGRPADAALEFRRALETDPSFTPASDALRRLTGGK